MTIDKGIQIKNIYFMLSYAFKELRHNNYECIQKENFDNILDLMAEILYRGVSKQLKQGMHRTYVPMEESLPTIRGKINLQETIRNRMQRKRLVGCEFDELSENNIYNRILKTTLHRLIRDKGVKKDRKMLLRKVWPFFNVVEVIEPRAIKWQSLTYRKDNATYAMLMNICYFILESLLLTTEEGAYKLPTFSENRMPWVFENFVLEYYKRHHKELQASADKVKWNISNGTEEMIRCLPGMQTDITLKAGDRTLIIDTKYYTRSMVVVEKKEELRSAHLYQVFSYVKNTDVAHSGKVQGMLLYAKTDEDIAPDLDADFDGNHMAVRTLDLNCEFDQIRAQLDRIAKNFINGIDG